MHHKYDILTYRPVANIAMEVRYFSVQRFVCIVSPFVVESFAAARVLAVVSYCAWIVVDHVFVQCFFGRIVFVVTNFAFPLRLVPMAIFVLVELFHSHEFRTADVAFEWIVGCIVCWCRTFLLLAHVSVALIDIMVGGVGVGVAVFFGRRRCGDVGCALRRFVDRYKRGWIMKSWKVWN